MGNLHLFEEGGKIQRGGSEGQSIALEGFC